MATKRYNRYHDGALVRLTATFADTEGILRDPTTITVRLRAPDGSVDSYTYSGGDIVRDSVGEYHKDFNTTDFPQGVWFYKWIGTGTVVSANEWAFIINYEQAS